MSILYRILTIINNTVALLLAVSVFFSLPILFSSPLTMLSAFMMISIILYAFYSNRFIRTVLQQQQPVKPGLKDWIRVNGIVALVFSIIIIIDVAFLIRNPQIYVEAVKNLGVELPVEKVTGFFWVMLVYGLVLLTHVLWTFSLMKKYREYFSKEEA